MDPDYNSPLIYWWGYCKLSIPFRECSFNIGGGGWVEIRQNPEFFCRPPSFSDKFTMTPLQ